MVWGAGKFVVKTARVYRVNKDSSDKDGDSVRKRELFSISVYPVLLTNMARR